MLIALPVGYGPGIEAAHSLVGHVAQVGVVRCFVPSNVLQRAAGHRDDSSPTRLGRTGEGGPGLPCILGYRDRLLLPLLLLCRQAVVRDQTVREGNRRGCLGVSGSLFFSPPLPSRLPLLCGLACRMNCSSSCEVDCCLLARRPRPSAVCHRPDSLTAPQYEQWDDKFSAQDTRELAGPPPRCP